jgi:transitional endoplasmic reticulum ATPase
LEDVELTVAEAVQTDVGQGKARIDAQTRVELDLSPGDIIRIEGKSVSAAVVWRMLSEDENKGIIRIDGLVRKNVNASLGDHVKVTRADVKPAQKVVLAPNVADNHRIQFGTGIEAFIKRSLIKRPVMEGDTIIVQGIALMGGALPFQVQGVAPDGVVKVVDSTSFVVMDEPVGEADEIRTGISYEDIGGLDEEVRRVREMIELPLRHPELFNRLGIEAPKGVLLHGPPGTGKTLIARAVVNESGASFFTIQGPEIMSKYYGESEAQLRKRFDEAEENAPSVVFIDEIDSIAPKRGEGTHELERRIVAQLLTLMDGLQGRGKVIVIAATNRVNDVDAALRRPGRFDREIEIGVPDRDGRRVILQIHTRTMPLADDFDLEHFVDVTHGYVGADLAALAREAAMKALRRLLPDIDLEAGGSIPAGVLENLQVTHDDFKDAFKEVEPSTLRDVFTEPPRTSWEDVGGMEDVKAKLKEAVEMPLRRPEAFTRLGITPPRGVLLFGPPGVGKTMVAKAAAKESTANFITVKGPEILSKWVGESEKAIREIFRKAKQSAPTIIFIDEIDSIAAKRGSHGDSGATERVVNQLLTSMDSFESLGDVIVLAATNRPDMIDPSILRPGRFDRIVYIPPPDTAERRAILGVHTRDMPLEGVDLDGLAVRLEGYTGADIASLVREAAMAALREDVESDIVTSKHMEEAMEMVRPSLDEETIKYFQHISKLLEGRMARRKRDDINVSYQ